MDDKVSWILELAIKDGELDNFQSLMHEMVDATKANEPNTLNYEWTISENRKNCHIYERYADSDATMIHLGTFGIKYGERFMDAVEVTRLVVYGNPNGEVRDALSGMDALYMSPFGGFAR